MGKKHRIIDHCYKTNCNECHKGNKRSTVRGAFGACRWHYKAYRSLFLKIRELKRNGLVEHLSIEEFRLKLQHQPKGVSADRLALKAGENPAEATKQLDG